MPGRGPHAGRRRAPAREDDCDLVATGVDSVRATDGGPPRLRGARTPLHRDGGVRVRRLAWTLTFGASRGARVPIPAPRRGPLGRLRARRASILRTHLPPFAWSGSPALCGRATPLQRSLVHCPWAVHLQPHRVAHWIRAWTATRTCPSPVVPRPTEPTAVPVRPPTSSWTRTLSVASSTPGWRTTLGQLDPRPAPPPTPWCGSTGRGSPAACRCGSRPAWPSPSASMPVRAIPWSSATAVGGPAAPRSTRVLGPSRAAWSSPTSTTRNADPLVARVHRGRRPRSVVNQLSGCRGAPGAPTTRSSPTPCRRPPPGAGRSLAVVEAVHGDLARTTPVPRTRIMARAVPAAGRDSAVYAGLG